MDDILTNLKDQLSLNFNNRLLIDELVVGVGIGILIKDGLIFRFPHRSLQEYFAARHISTSATTEKNVIYSNLKKYLENPYNKIMHRNHFHQLLS